MNGAFAALMDSGLHQPFIVGNRVFLGYGSGNNGVLQILATEKFLKGARRNISESYI